MHGPAQPTDISSPSTGADIALVLSLILVLTGLASGVIWSQQAGMSGADWRGAVPPLVVAGAAVVLLRARAAYPELPRLRRFLTRVATVGLLGAAVLAVHLATQL